MSYSSDLFKFLALILVISVINNHVKLCKQCEMNIIYVLRGPLEFQNINKFCSEHLSIGNSLPTTLCGLFIVLMSPQNV